MNGLQEQLLEILSHSFGESPPAIHEGRFTRWGKGQRLWLRYEEVEIEGNLFVEYRAGDWSGQHDAISGRIPDHPISQAELAQLRAVQARLREAERAERDRQQLAAAEEVEKKWALLRQEFQHPYLDKKLIKSPFGTRCKEADDPFYTMLYIPLRDVHGRLWSVQTIQGPQGTKSFLPGGRKRGCMHVLIGKIETAEQIVIAEGFATAAAIAQSISGSIAVIAAMDTSNLLPVAGAIRLVNPSALFIFAADSDPSGAGERYATEAANHCGGIVVLPKFGDVNGTTDPGAPRSDFQDLLALQGPDALKHQIEAALVIAQSQSAGIDRSAEGFEGRSDGLFKISDKGQEKVCSYIKILGWARDFNQADWSKVVELKDRDGNRKRIVIKSEKLVGQADEAVKDLVNAGLRIAGPGMVPALKTFLLISDPAQSLRIANRNGWHNLETGRPIFLLGDRCVGTDERIVRLQDGPLADTICIKGSVASWRDEVCAPLEKQIRPVFAVSFAFSASLYRLLGQESGGFHFYGPSSKGKTLLARLASSVYGGPSEKYLRTWRGTSNGVEAVAEAYSDILLPLDELGQIEPKILGETIYALGNAQGKSRMNRDATLKKRKSWVVAILSTGEITVSAHAKEGGKDVRAGVMVRLTDLDALASDDLGVFSVIPAGFADTFEFAKHLEERLKRNYGAPIGAFIEWVTPRLDTLAGRFAEERQYLLDALTETQVSSQIRRVVDRFALASLAGSIATEAGLTGWNQGTARTAAVLMLESWVGERGTTSEDDEARTLIDNIQNFFTQHESRFEYIGPENAPWDEGRVVHNKAGYIVTDGLKAPQFRCVHKAVFQKEILRGISPKKAASVLHKHGLLWQGKADYRPKIKNARPSTIPILESVVGFSFPTSETDSCS